MNAASFCERSVRSIMEMLSRVMDHRKTLKWKDVLHDVISNFNRKTNRAHGLTPNQAEIAKNHQLVWDRLYGNIGKPKPAKFKPNQRVHISVIKGSYEKGDLFNTTDLILYHLI